MIGIVVASHGEFCSGLLSSAKMIVGEIENCQCVSLLPGDDPDEYGERIELAIDQVNTGKGVLVFVDLRGGTPFNQTLLLCQKKDIQIIVGANLPMLLVAALGRNEDICLNELACLAATDGKEAIDNIKYDR